ncbi:hypothetical protein ACFYUR_19160 [Micromonospora haikouensis]|uniref:hypothetical protein n=1 Tax=Micromonospora haikouensis TaxID=686309 RepID=UPI0036A1D2F0
MTVDGFNQDAYSAACRALSGRYNGDIHDTAEKITRILQAQQERHGIHYMLRLTQSFTARSSIVVQLAGLAEAAGVRGGAAHARPLLDNAVAVTARTLWNASFAARKELNG